MSKVLKNKKIYFIAVIGLAVLLGIFWKKGYDMEKRLTGQTWELMRSAEAEGVLTPELQCGECQVLLSFSEDGKFIIEETCGANFWSGTYRIVEADIPGRMEFTFKDGDIMPGILDVTYYQDKRAQDTVVLGMGKKALFFKAEKRPERDG